MDTLALVYLGCVLRQEPVRIADLFRWAKNNQIPFLGAVSSTMSGFWRCAADHEADRLRAQGVA
jgi:hypothetical protein